MKTKFSVIRSLVSSVLILLVLMFFVRSAAGDLYVSDRGADAVYLYGEDRVQHLFASVNYPLGLAFDRTNNLYVASNRGDAIYKIRPDGQKRVFAAGDVIRSPVALVFDSAGNLFASHHGTSPGIVKITPNGRVSAFVDGVQANGLAFDNAGYLYASDLITHSVLKIAPDGTITIFAQDFDMPEDLKFDPTGNLLVSEYRHNAIYKILPNGFYDRFSPVTRPIGLVFDHSGILFGAELTDLRGYIQIFFRNGGQTTFTSGEINPGYLAVPNSL